MRIIDLKNLLEQYPNAGDVSIGGLALEAMPATRNGNTIDFNPSFCDPSSSPRSEPAESALPKASPLKPNACK